MSVLFEKRFAAIGAGNIGRILLERLLDAGVPETHLVVCDSDTGRASAAAERYGVRAAALHDEVVCRADVWLVATSPVSVVDVVKALSGAMQPGQIVVSFAAAVPVSRLEALVPDGVSVVRVMPNAPSLVGQGMNPVVYGVSATPDVRVLVEAVLAILGDSIEVADDQMNWCVGLSGAAMRSLVPVLEGMTQAGVEAGLSESIARRIAAQVMLGTAAIALETDLSWEEIKGLTPMQTVDEPAVTQLFVDAARGAKAKIDGLQRKLWEGTPTVS
jgi:pyrroline-5-carboxylate reductase